MRKRHLGFMVLPLVVLAGCTGRESPGTSYDLRWVGAVTPEAGRCPPSSVGTLTAVVRDRSVTFTPNDGVLVLQGTVGSDGTVHAAFAAQGADRHPFPLRLDATLSEAGVTGTYTSPICRSHVELHPPTPLPRRLFSPGNILGIGNP